MFAALLISTMRSRGEMQDEQCFPETADGLSRIVLLEIVQKLLADGEGAAADVYLRFARGDNQFLAIPQEVLDVLRLIR